MVPQTKTLKFGAAAIGGLLLVCLFALIATPAALIATLCMLGLGMAVSANQILKRSDGRKQPYPVAASTRLYQATMAFVNSGGYAALAGAVAFAGIVDDEADNSSGSNGDIDVECWQEGTFELGGAGFTQADVGLDVYALDNYTVTATPSAATLKVGKIVEFISATRVRVKIDVITGLQS